MNNLMKKIADVMDNPSEVINSIKPSPTVTKAALTLAVVGAVLNPVSQAYAHADPAPHVHYEYAQILGESELVRDHIQNVADYIGFSIDQNNDYLNYEHPIHSKLNDYIKYAKNNYSDYEFNEVINLASKAQQHFDNGHYKRIGEEAHHLMSLTDKSPLFLIDTTPEGESYNAESVKHENLQATIDLFNKMQSDKSFGFDFKEVNISQEDLEFHRIAVRNKAEEKGFVVSYLSNDDGGVVNNAHLAAWYSNGMDFSSDEYKEMAHNVKGIEFFKEAYNLTDYDIEKLQKIADSHEMGHLNKFPEIEDRMNSGPESEFSAEVMSVWNDVKSGTSEGFLKFRKEGNLASIGVIKPDTPPHYGYGALKTFYDQFSYNEVKDMSLGDITKELRTFIKNVPEDVLDFGQYALHTAQNAVENEGIFPTAQEYFKSIGEDSKAEMLNSVKDIPNSDIDHIFHKQVEILKDKNASFYSKFMAENFPSSLGNTSKTELPVDYLSEIEYVRQLNQHMSSGAHYNTDFTYQTGIVKNGFDTADTFIQFSPNAKLSSDGVYLKKINDVQTMNSDIKIESMTEIKPDSITVNVMDANYDEMDIRFTRNGDMTVSVNGGKFEKLKSEHLDSFDLYTKTEFVDELKHIVDNNEKMELAQKQKSEQKVTVASDLKNERANLLDELKDSTTIDEPSYSDSNKNTRNVKRKLL